MGKLPLLALLLLAACPEQFGQQCPAHSISVGQYSLDFKGTHPAGECASKQPDGGLAVLVQENGGSRGATVCLGSGPDGGPQLQLVVAGKGARLSDLLADGGFHFGGHSDPVSGTPCGCQVAIDETFDGFLQTTPDGPIALQSDGGLPRITGIAGSLTDTLSADAGTTGCLCALPCPVTYAITGTRF